MSSRVESLREVSEKMVERREFLSSIAGVAALGGANFPALCKDMLGQAPDKLPDSALYDKDEEAYWTEIRKQFLIPEDQFYLNNGTVGSSPAPVLAAVFGFAAGPLRRFDSPHRIICCERMWIGI